MTISRQLRWRILSRDNFTCQYCGHRPPDVALEVDHITPQSKGGTDEETNLLTACTVCNGGKSAGRVTTPGSMFYEDVKYLAEVKGYAPLVAYAEAVTVRAAIIEDMWMASAHLWPVFQIRDQDWPYCYDVLRLFEVFGFVDVAEMLGRLQDSLTKAGISQASGDARPTIAEALGWVVDHLVAENKLSLQRAEIAGRPFHGLGGAEHGDRP